MQRGAGSEERPGGGSSGQEGGKGPTMVENSGVGESRANGAAEKAAQAMGEQAQVTRCGLESCLGAKIKVSQVVTCWLAQHCADVALWQGKAKGQKLEPRCGSGMF